MSNAAEVAAVEDVQRELRYLENLLDDDPRDAEQIIRQFISIVGSVDKLGDLVALKSKSGTSGHDYD